MATAAPPADKTADLLQKLSLDPQAKTVEVSEANKKASGLQRGSIDGGEVNSQIQSADRCVTPIIPDFSDPAMCYYPNGYPSTAYYYGGYDGSMNEWEYVNSEGVDVRSGVYGDNGSLMYPGYNYGPYGPYSPATSPVPTMGHDGQLYGPQQYQYPTYYQSPSATSEHYTPTHPPATQGEVSTSFTIDHKPLSAEVANGNAKGSVHGNSNATLPLRPTQPNSSFNSNGSYNRSVFQNNVPASGYQDPRFGFEGNRSSVPWLDSAVFPDGKHRQASSLFSSISHTNNIQTGRNQNRALPNLMGLQAPRPSSGMGPTHGLMNRMYPNNRIYGQYGSNNRTVTSFGTNGYDSRINGRAWMSVESKYRPKGRGNGFYLYGNENVDGLNELNRGPRARGFRNQKGFSPVTLAVKGQNITSNGNNEDKNCSSLVPDREQYNREDFPESYENAKFFIIKSYSEDDVHKSIKYGVWASTPNGNKKLDSGYQEAQEKTGACPVFLFFSVNTSGQFVGLAEMVGSVDFNKNLEYWQQDKWNGCFPVKWHIIKDVPNSLLKHITLENNDNKPVTNSRDTQEVKFEQGLQMIKIFKEHSNKTCILDDFGFYEARQITVQEKKAKQQQYQKQVSEGKPVDTAPSSEKDKGVSNGRLRLQSSLEVTSVISNDSSTAQGTGEHKHSEEGEIIGQRDALRGSKPILVTEKRTLANGVANAC